MLVDGKWVADWQPVQKADEKGRFVRQTSSFRNWITLDGSPGPTGTGGFRAEAGRYRLYVALICPWASRTLMAAPTLRPCAIIKAQSRRPQSTMVASVAPPEALPRHRRCRRFRSARLCHPLRPVPADLSPPARPDARTPRRG
jgi:hypothetical protein